MIRPVPLPQLPSAPGCRSCDLGNVARSVGIGTHWIPDSRAPGPGVPAVVLLGQNPGWNEDREGVPFIGKSGELVQDVYCQGISLQRLASMYVANTARCFHREGDGPANKHYKACRPRLIPDLQAISDLHGRGTIHVLTLGAPAATHLYALFGVKRSLADAMEKQGFQAEYVEGDHTVRLVIVSTFHPAAVLRTRNLIYAVQGHMQVLLDRLTGNVPQVTKVERVPPRSPVTK